MVTFFVINTKMINFIIILFLFFFFYGRHQNGHKVMFAKDVVVHFSGILKPCGTREQLVSDRYSRFRQTIEMW